MYLSCKWCIYASQAIFFMEIIMFSAFNPFFSPHDALMHHFTSLKTALIFPQPRALEWIFPWNWFTNTSFFVTFSPTSNHLHPLQVENCDSNSRLVVDEDDNGKFRPERVKWHIKLSILKLVNFYSLWGGNNSINIQLTVSKNMMTFPSS